MYELIFRFLLDSGYPRGAIVTDHAGSDAGQNYHPTFLIADPDSAEILAVIDLVESGTREDLSSHALHAGRYAARLGAGKAKEAGAELVQAFVIQVDQANPVEEDQVGFYKLLPGKKMQKVSSYAFPDLDALRVDRRLKSMNGQTTPAALAQEQSASTERIAARDKKILYAFALVLLIVGLADWGMTQTRGSGLFTLQQILLLLCAVALVLFPILAKHLRR